ncbi:MAG: hypothetical protein LC779_01520 [Actinobacteria bacterium]|nr:hypothetical protein [Actinomycetota bacterium]
MSAALGVTAALGSACFFGLATAGQHGAVAATPARGSLDPRLLRDLSRSPVWWATAPVELAAVALQVLAFRSTSVVLVQAVLVLGLPLGLLLSGQAGRRTWTGLTLTAAGVGVFGAAQRHIPVQSGSVVVPVVVAFVGALLLVRRPTPVLAGAVAGVVTGSAAVLLAAAAALPLHLLLVRPPLYAAAVVGLLAVQVGQSALRTDQLGIPLAALTVAEPVASAALAALALHQLPQLPPAAVLAAVLAAFGVFLLHNRSTHSTPLDAYP